MRDAATLREYGTIITAELAGFGVAEALRLEGARRRIVGGVARGLGISELEFIRLERSWTEREANEPPRDAGDEVELGGNRRDDMRF